MSEVKKLRILLGEDNQRICGTVKHRHKCEYYIEVDGVEHCTADTRGCIHCL